MTRIYREVEDAASKLRAAANTLISGSLDPNVVASRLRRLADDLQSLARKLKRANQEPSTAGAQDRE